MHKKSSIMSERELMILERRIRRNLKRSLKLSHEIHMSSSFRERNDNTASFARARDDDDDGGGGGDGVISPLLVANIYSCNSICGHNYYHSQYGNSAPNAWWKARKATPSMIVSVPVRRLKKKKKKKCVKCKAAS